MQDVMNSCDPLGLDLHKYQDRGKERLIVVSVPGEEEIYNLLSADNCKADGRLKLIYQLTLLFQYNPISIGCRLAEILN